MVHLASYEILPAIRTWGADAERLAQALIDDLEFRGCPSPDERAALFVLFRDPALTFAELEFMDYVRLAPAGADGARVHWLLLASNVLSARFLHTQPATRALILFACALAHEAVRVPMIATLSQLAEPERQTVLDAIAIAAQVTR